MQPIDEFMPVAEIMYWLVDIWYTSGKLMFQAFNKRHHTIGRIKFSRVILPELMEYWSELSVR